MPMIEVVYVKDEPLKKERKTAFVEKAVGVFNEEIGTPPPRLRVVFQHVKPEDSKHGLVDMPEVAEQAI